MYVCVCVCICVCAYMGRSEVGLEYFPLFKLPTHTFFFFFFLHKVVSGGIAGAETPCVEAD